jgi:hypothetical protein
MIVYGEMRTLEGKSLHIIKPCARICAEGRKEVKHVSDAVYSRTNNRLVFPFQAVCILPEARTKPFCLLYVNFYSKR